MPSPTSTFSPNRSPRAAASLTAHTPAASWSTTSTLAVSARTRGATSSSGSPAGTQTTPATSPTASVAPGATSATWQATGGNSRAGHHRRTCDAPEKSATRQICRSVRETALVIGHAARVPTVLELWLEYDGGPLWCEHGRTVELASVGLPLTDGWRGAQSIEGPVDDVV